MTVSSLLCRQPERFDIPDDVAYLNCAYMGPMLKTSLEAYKAGVARKSHPWALTAQHFFDESDQVRSLFGQLIHADAEGVALIPSVSYGIAIAARNLPVKANQTIVTLADQFPSNVYAWREKAGKRVTVELDADLDPTARVLEAITSETAIAALPNILWTNGARLDLEAIGKRCREVGAALVLDLTQSLGVLPFDCEAVQPDFLIAANYKWLLGPYTTAQIWIAPQWRDGVPLEQTWLGREGSENFSRLIDYTDGLQPGAQAFDMGQRSNFAALPAVIDAFEQLFSWNIDRLYKTLSARTNALADRLNAMGLSCPDLSWRGGHYLTAKLPATAPPGIVDQLAQEKIYISQRGEHLRITPHLWVTESDEDRLIERLARLLERQPA